MRIIVVDDEINALHVFLNEIIEEQNIDYKFFRNNTAEICRYVAHNTVDAAFLDIKMPETNGIELAEKLIQILPSIKLVFMTGLSVTAAELTPYVRSRTLGFLYKPYSSDELIKYLSLIKEEKRVLTVKMFDTFDCFIGNKRVSFSSSKSKELFALLLSYNGRTLTMNDAISQLWPDGDAEKSKILYRDAVWRLRKVLNDIDIHCIQWGRGALSLDKGMIECDYWDYLITGKGSYHGEFCKSYDWSVMYLAELDSIRERGACMTAR